MDEDTKFRRALKSPIVMIGLCILAGAAVYDSIIDSTLNSSLPSVGAIVDFPASVELDPTPLAPSQTGHDVIATQWTNNPKRDPFSPVTANKWTHSSAKELLDSRAPENQQSPKASRQSLTLKAIAIEAQHRSAVINHQVVYEGEIVEGYKVVSIQLQGVWLNRHGKKKFLTFAANTTS